MKSIFGLGSKYFIQLSADNRIKLWDTISHKEHRSYIEKRHLSHSYTCMAWSQKQADHLGLFAVGTSDGLVVLWDLTRGVVLREIGNLNDSPPVPTGIAFSKDGKRVYVASNHKYILEYNIASGEQVNSFKIGKKGVACFSLHPKLEVIAYGNSTVKLLDLSTLRKRSLSGHFSGGVKCISFSSCGFYLFCAAVNSREVLVYNLNADDEEECNPIRIIDTSGYPKSIEAKSFADVLDILVLYEDSDATVFRVRSIMESDREAHESCSIKFEHSVFAGHFSESADSVIMASGQLSKLMFENVVFADSGSVRSEVTMSARTRKVDDGQAGDLTSSTLATPSSVIAPDGMGAARKPAFMEESIGIKRSRDEIGDSSSSNFVRTADLTLEERLDQLSSSMTTLENSVSHEAGRFSDGFFVRDAPTSDSLVTLIDQALQSGDDVLLEQCLACDDMDVIEGTASRLGVNRVVSFMRKLVSKFEKRPSRGILLTRWLSAMLRCHASYLISVPDLASQLTGLSQMLEQRLSSYSRLTSLIGRLDLLMARASARPGQSTDGSISQPSIPLNVYQEE